MNYYDGKFIEIAFIEIEYLNFTIHPLFIFINPQLCIYNFFLYCSELNCMKTIRKYRGKYSHLMLH